MNTFLLRWLGFFFACLEIIILVLSITIFVQRLGTGLLSSLFLGLQCIHVVAPFTLFAAISVDNNKYAVQGSNVLYCFVALLDLVATLITLFIPKAFPGELYWWTVGLNLTFFLLDCAIILMLTAYNIDVSQRLRIGQQVVLQDKKSEYLARQEVWLPTRRVFKLKRLLARTWKAGLVVYMLYMTAAIIENIFSLRMTWILLTSVPYLWSWPFLNVVVGPGGESNEDPEPWINTRPHGTVIMTYALLIAGLLGVIASITGTIWYWPVRTLSVVLSSITVSFLGLLALFHIWTVIQMIRLDVAVKNSESSDKKRN